MGASWEMRCWLALSCRQMRRVELLSLLMVMMMSLFCSFRACSGDARRYLDVMGNKRSCPGIGGGSGFF